MTPLLIHGAAGRMGRRLVALAADDPQLRVTAALEHADHPALGQDAGQLAGTGGLGVPLATLGDPACLAAIEQAPNAVLIDFSLPAGFQHACASAAEHKLPLVVGTTGLNEQDHAQLDQLAKRVPVLQATNFSLVVNVLWKLAADAATLLEGYDIEVLESHHHGKRDAPSGTAHTLVERLCQATGKTVSDDVLYTRHGDDVLRKPNEITVQTLRLGDDPGQHTAFFAGPGERLEIKHVSTSRDSYALGALRAAKWLATQKPGRYTMGDVLGV
ncbi:MAG: 4-hydroxy-tetrahydrodipicolinate reductase [Phycisphaerales bacterium JB063]